MTKLELTRPQIQAFRRQVGSLDARMSRGRRSLRRAAWAGLQDSMPRAALLSIHARVAKTEPTTWEDPSLVQVWGPRFSVFVVAQQDVALFTLGRHPDDPKARERAEDLAARLSDAIGDRKVPHDEAEEALGIGNNRLRYAATTGTVLIRWEGARQPLVWSVTPPDVDPRDARRELARRYLHIFGPTTPEAFSVWAGMSLQEGADAFDRLRRSLTPVRTPVGDAWILTRDADAFRASPAPAAARLLPSGDAYYLLQDDHRKLLVPDAERRKALWTSRVWPGAVLVEGHIVGTWRRAGSKLTIQTWSRVSRKAREAVENEAESLPLPGLHGRINVQWDGG